MKKTSVNKSIKLNEDKIYVGSELYLPLKHFNTNFMELSLTILDGRKKVKLFGLTKTHLIAPKYYLSNEDIIDSGCEIEKLPPIQFPKVEFKHNIILREGQKEAWINFKKSEGGILNLAPGKGKTVLSLLKIAEEGVPALISVNTTSILSQWCDFINKFLDIQDIGIIQGNKFDWKKSICVATIQSLLSKIKNKEIPEEFSNWFGNYFIDEGHHIAAPNFCLTASICKGNKYILTATEKRTDNKERYIKYYFGDIIHSDKTYDLIPRIKIININSTVMEELHAEKTISALARNKSSNIERAKYIKEYSKGRKSILVSTRVEQLEELAKYFPNSCTVTSKLDRDDRLPLVRKSELSFIIDNFGIEALDCPELDTLFILLPISADRNTRPDGTVRDLGNNLTQIMGRILRIHEDKNSPLVIIFDDVNVPVAHKQIQRLVMWLEANGFKIDGK